MWAGLARFLDMVPSATCLIRQRGALALGQSDYNIALLRLTGGGQVDNRMGRRKPEQSQIQVQHTAMICLVKLEGRDTHDSLSSANGRNKCPRDTWKVEMPKEMASHMNLAMGSL